MSLLPATPSVPTQSAPGAIPCLPGWKVRAAATACYFGLAPLLRIFRIHRGDPFIQHHAAQALATILAFLAVLFGYCLYGLAISYVLVFRRDLYERLPSFGGWGDPVREMLLVAPVFLGWLLSWFGGLLLALYGSRRTLPLIGWLARRPFLLRLAFIGNVSLLATASLIAALALHATYLTRDDDEPAAAYLLYDDMEFIPRWVMNVGFYRISLAAQARWGPGNTIVAPLDEEHLRLALHHGRFVFLACHGEEGKIITPRIRIIPYLQTKNGDTTERGLLCRSNLDGGRGDRRWTLLAAGQELRYVYNTACDSGMKAEQWEQALAPARVRTFDRLSAVVEHILWLWSDGPRFVREME